MKFRPLVLLALCAIVVGGCLLWPQSQAEDQELSWQRHELRASTYSYSKQYGASLALDQAGNALVTWQSKRQQDRTHGVYGQRFTSSGVRGGAEIQLNLTTASQQTHASAVFLGNQPTVAWESLGQDGSGTGCYMRSLDETGETRVHEVTAGDQTDVCLAKGARDSVIACWLDRGQPFWRSDTSASQPVADARATQVAMDSADDGRFVIVWSARGTDGAAGIQARCFDPDGRSGPVLRINPANDTGSIEPSLDVAPDGSFAVTWLSWSDRTSGYDVLAQRYAPNGHPLGETLVVSRHDGAWHSGAHCAIAENGQLCVAWNRDGTGGTSILARLITGSTFSEPFPITRRQNGNQRLLTAGGRRCMAFHNDRLYVAWSGDGGQGDTSAAHLTILTPRRFLPTTNERLQLAEPHKPPVLVKMDYGPAAALAGGPDFGFQGLSRVQWSPSDVHIAAGPEHIVQITNDEIAFYDKNGKRSFKSLIWGTKGFWSSVSASGKIFDPEVHWDPHSQRFVAFANEKVGFGTSLFVLAISDDKNPNGTWHKFRFDVTKLVNTGQGGGGIDSPNIGIDSQAFYLTGDIPFQGTKRQLVYILEKKNMLSGKAPGIVKSLLMTGKVKLGMPVVHGTIPGGEMFMLEELTTTIGGSAKAIRLWAIQSPLKTPKLVSVDITVPTYTRSGSVTARGASVKIATFDSRFWSMMWRKGSLWACHHIGSSVVKARWYEIKTNVWPAKGKPTLVQTGDVDLGKGVHSAYNAITTDADGNAMMVFAVGSANHYMSIGHAWRKTSDKLGTMRPARIVKASTVLNRVFRWGDYGGIAPDPVEPNTIWYGHQLAASNWNWTTWIGKKVLGALGSSRATLPQTGGTVEFYLDNPSHKNRAYLIVGTVSGTKPGFRLGSVTVPINPDLATQVGLQYTNTTVLSGFLGKLDATGWANATLNMPGHSSLLGLTFHFAFVQDGTVWDFASNAVPLRIVK